MMINSVVGYNHGNTANFRIHSQNITFGQAPKNSREKAQLQNVINRGYDALGKQIRAMIIHGPSFPVNPATGINQGIGSPYFQKDFTEFEKMFGFNAQQLGPSGMLRLRSPYDSSIFEKDPRLINLEALSGSEFGNILPTEDLKRITSKYQKSLKENKNRNYTRANYDTAQKISQEAMSFAYKRLKSGSKLSSEFAGFKKSQKHWLDERAVLRMIVDEKYQGNDYYPNWDQEDINLLDNYRRGDVAAIKRFKAIESKYAKEIELYKFTQFIAYKQEKLNKDFDSNTRVITDTLVGQSNLDILSNREIFMEDWCLGASSGGPQYPGGPMQGSPQAWGVPLIDPTKIFDRFDPQNGIVELGPAGRYIKEKVQSALRTNNLTRIDNVFGYGNPYVVDKRSIPHATGYRDDGVRYLMPDKLNSGFLLDYDINIEGKENYRHILPYIIVPAIKEMGVNPADIVWEDLGINTGEWYDEIAPQAGITGMVPYRWWSAEGARNNNKTQSYAFVTNHDGAVASQVVKDPSVDQTRALWEKDYLSKYLQYALYDTYNPTEQDLVKAKFVEMLSSVSNKLQISWMDFFGIEREYNTPGTSDEENPDNWTLRLTQDYKDKYFKALEDPESFAINIPEVLRMAIETKIDNFEIERDEEIEALLDELAQWEKYLKKKTPRS